jgi:putative inorganic carbon (HCO3(-)) transporter
VTVRVSPHSWLWPSVVAVVASGLGLLAVIQPALALGAAFGLAFAVVVTANLTIGVAIMAFLAFTEVLPGLGSLSAAKVAGGVVVLSWLAASTTGRPTRQFFGAHREICAVVILFLGWVTAGIAWAQAPGEIGSALVRYVPDLLLLPLTFAAVRSGADIRHIVAAFVVGALLSTVYGAFIAPGDLDAAAAGRVSGAGTDANELASGLVAAMAICGGATLDRKLSGLVRLSALVAVFVLFFALVVTASRSGIIALVVSLLAVVVIAGPRRRIAAALLVVTILGLGTAYVLEAAPATARQRLQDYSGGGSGRTSIWKVAVQVGRAHWLEGVGSQNFPVVSRQYLFTAGEVQRSDFIVDDPLPVHDTYLELWVETGIVGLALFLAIIGWVLSCGIRAARRFRAVGDRSLEILSRSVMVATVALLAAGVFMSFEHIKSMWVLFAISPALLKVSRRDPDEGTRPSG